MREGKDQVEVAHGQQLGLLLLQPASLGNRLALGTVAVSAGGVGRGLKAALGASLQRAPRRVELLVPDLEVALGALHRVVAQQSLNGAKVHPGFQKMSGKAVPK